MTEGVFTSITGDGMADRMLSATEMLKQRTERINESRSHCKNHLQSYKLSKELIQRVVDFCKEQKDDSNQSKKVCMP